MVDVAMRDTGLLEGEGAGDLEGALKGALAANKAGKTAILDVAVSR